MPLWAAALCVHAQQGGDLEAQILYAFHTEDANQLSSLVQTLNTQSQTNGTDDTLRYHLAHAQYRLGLVQAEAHGRHAESAFSGCVEQLKPMVEREDASAEALLLQAACYNNLAKYDRLEAIFLRARGAERLTRAQQLAPRNPRVALYEALDARDASSLPKFQLAAQLFEQTSATGADAPAWGHAEAYLELGRRLEARGDVLGARNWIEKSLLVAPDYKAAQRQYATLVH